MVRTSLVPALTLALSVFGSLAQTQPGGPYKVLKTEKVAGDGGFDYIYADVAARRLYIPRGGTRAVPATDTAPAVAAAPGRITVFNLDTLAPGGGVASPSPTSTRAHRSARSRTPAATASRSTRNRATGSRAAGRSRCST